MMERVRRLWLRLCGRRPVLTGECLRCGQCCRGIHLKLDARWLRSEADFQRALAKYPRYRIFEITGRDARGLLRFSCTRLSESGLCTDYENRPSVCRNYPSPAMFCAGARLIEGCGFRLKASRDFERLLGREMRRRARGKGPVVEEREEARRR